MDILLKLRVLNLHVLCLCSSWQPGLLWWWRSNQVLLHMFLVSAPCFPQRAGQLIASLIIGGPGRGHEYHLAHGTANMAGFLFHLPLKLNHFCAKIDCCKFAYSIVTVTRVTTVFKTVHPYCNINHRTTQ